MSLNKAKAKAKPKMAIGGSNSEKPAVMNRRKYNEAISGDTMSNYAMYKKGGKVKKYQPGGEKEPKAQVKKPDEDVFTKIVKAPGMLVSKGLYGIMKGAEKTANFVKKNEPAIRKAGSKMLEAGSKMERGPKQKKGGTTKSKKK
jgi:hypothetical protein